MTLRSELLELMAEVSSTNCRSPREVTASGVKCFDFIAARGKSLIAVMDTMDRLHRERYQPTEPVIPPAPVKQEGVAKVCTRDCDCVGPCKMGLEN